MNRRIEQIEKLAERAREGHTGPCWPDWQCDGCYHRTLALIRRPERLWLREAAALARLRELEPGKEGNE